MRLGITLLLASSGVLAAGELNLAAPNPKFTPIDQLRISGNACGPAALLNAYGFGSERWQKVGNAIPGDGSRGQMSYIIRAHGLHPSKHLADRLRWNRKNGVNLLDLTDIGNELAGGKVVPQLNSEVLVLTGRENPQELLQRTHARLAKSLKKGFPPIVSLRRVARPGGSPPAQPTWRVVHGHFVVITALPAKLERKANSFQVRYVDPWGGRILEGTFRADPGSRFPTLIASVPSSKVGADNVKDGEVSLVSLSAVIGAF